MNPLLDPRRAHRSRRPSESQAPPVSVLRWPAGRSAEGVFEMFSAQQASRSGALDSESPVSADGQENVLLVSASRRVAPDPPAVLLSLVNTSPSQAVRLSLKLAGRTPTSLTGTILTAPSMPRAERARKGFGASSRVRPSVFRGAVLKGKVVEITVPARSVVVLTVVQHSLIAVKSGPAKRVR
jgi:alpha-L-arabinofuranosidase